MNRRGSWVRGGVAGVTATACMSALMLTSERVGIMTGQPPRLIVDRFVPGLEEGAATVATVCFHGLYGAVAGALYAAVTPQGRVSARSGLAYGLLLWAAGYEGWVPAAGVLPPAHRDDRRRVITMISAHLVYGSVLGRQLERR